MKTYITLLTLISGLFAISLSSFAGVSLDKTRIVFNESDKNQSINIINDSDKLYLVQNTILVDHANAQSEAVTQFVTVPPLARLEKNSRNAIRILPKDFSKLPADRESIFYFVVNLIPEGKKIKNNDNDIAANFNIATRIIIKVFYWPASVAGDADKLAGSLSFSTDGKRLTIKNPSGYFYTLEYLNLDGKDYHADRAPMVPPFSSVSLPVSGKINQVEWRVINDLGGASDLFKTTAGK